MLIKKQLHLSKHLSFSKDLLRQNIRAEFFNDGSITYNTLTKHFNLVDKILFGGFSVCL